MQKALAQEVVRRKNYLTKLLNDGRAANPPHHSYIRLGLVAKNQDGTYSVSEKGFFLYLKSDDLAPADWELDLCTTNKLAATPEPYRPSTYTNRARQKK